MSSFGSGGGSSSGGAGGQKPQIAGLGLDQISQQLAQQFAQQGQMAQQGGIRPGQAASMSPQQRLAAAMRSYSGGA